jgi:hypothetical protein
MTKKRKSPIWPLTKSDSVKSGFGHPGPVYERWLEIELPLLDTGGLPGLPGLFGGEASFVVHMLPLRRSVHDILVMATLVESARTYLKRVFQNRHPTSRASWSPC